MNEPTIICVDDEKIILDSLKSQLKVHFGNSMVIETVESAEEAIELIEELIEDEIEVPVVISDQIMPGMKGDQFLTKLHNEFPIEIKKIMLTGQADPTAVGNAINNAGLYRYIPKPWDSQDLNMTVSEAISSYEQSRQLSLIEQEKENLMMELKEVNEGLEKKIQDRTAELEKTNRYITDNINYAKLIQDAVIPEESEFNEFIPNGFVFFSPKDIVSGDFYWYKTAPQKKQYSVMLADCTGHGVAGAFMSLIGLTKLAETVRFENWMKPNLIFDELKRQIITTLYQTEGTHASGMDATMVSWDLNEMYLNFCGAFTKLYICRSKPEEQLQTLGGKEPKIKGESETHHVYVLDGDRQTIAKNERDHLPFTKQQIKLCSGDEIYLTSDGYVDQFGGNNEKKFLRSRFVEMLLSLAANPNEDRKEHLRSTFENWKGNVEQTDDVCVLGFKIP